MVDAVTDINVETTRRTKQRFVLGRPPSITVTSGVVLGIRLRFHNHAPKQVAVVLAFHQPATDEVGTHDLGGAGEERFGESREILIDGRESYERGLGDRGFCRRY